MTPLEISLIVIVIILMFVCFLFNYFFFESCADIKRLIRENEGLRALLEDIKIIFRNAKKKNKEEKT